MKKIGIVMAFLLLLFSGCAAQTDRPSEAESTPVQTESANAVEATAPSGDPAPAAGNETMETDDNETEDTMKLLIGETEVPVTWEENASVEALRALCPITIQMSMYGGFEQVGPLGQSIVRDDVRTDTDYGDIVLYSGNQIVIFYGSNSWAYTRLGHVDLTQREMSDLLGGGDTVITLK